MRTLTKIIFLIIILYSCKCQDESYLDLTDSEWYEAIPIGGSFAGISGNEFLLYKKFENNLLSDEILEAYSHVSRLLDYQVKDSISNYIKTRQNRNITNRLDTMLNISYISDTLHIKEPYLLLSEPFYINTEIVCFSLAYRNSIYSNGHWIYFFERGNNNLQIIGIYDTVKEQHYMLVKP